MKMTEHQKRLWLEMISLIQSYIKKETYDFYLLVGNLEGALDAAEIRNKVIVTQWYDFWTPLEIRRTIEGNKVNRAKAVKELEAMKLFLESQLDD